MWDQSTDAWRKALNVKPTPDFLTEPDKKLKLQSKPALIQKMPKRERKSPLSNPRLFDFISKENTHLEKAMALENQYFNERKLSSVRFRALSFQA